MHQARLTPESVAASRHRHYRPGWPGRHTTRPRRDCPEDGDAERGNIHSTASDPVVGETPVAVPGFQVEGAVTLPAVPIQGTEPADQLITVDQQAARIFIEQFADLLDGPVLSL